MRLDAWLRQQHSPAERFRLVERLAQALNALHGKGDVLAAIAPERIEVGADLKVDLAPAARGRPEPGYAAPELLEGGELTAAADIYGIGALCWEILAGRPCGEAPRPLADVVPDLPRDLANSVMGCLEKSPDWRPKDLTYLAQLAGAQQKSGRAPGPAAASRPASRPSKAATVPRAAPPRASRSQVPLFVAAALLVAGAAASYFWLGREKTSAPPLAARPVPTTLATPTPEPSPTPTPTPVATPIPTPAAARVAPVATPAPTPTPVRATPTPAPVPVAVATPPPPTPPPAVAAPAPTPTPASVAIEPASLTTLSPLTVRRGGRALLDIRGAGLRADHRVQILPIKEAPRGISVVRQKWTSDNLVTVLLELDGNVAPTVYALALESASGERTNPLHFTVTK
jgi:hypothetical protein